MPTPIKQGLTTIKWGSGATLKSVITAAIVARATFTGKNGAAIEVEDNDGFAAALVVLNDGFDATVECVYDSAITWPAIGVKIAMRRPRDAADLDCLLADIEDTVERKKEAMLTLKLHYRPGVTLT